MEETFASFLAVNPLSAGLNDIRMGENLFEITLEGDAELRILLLQKLGSLYTETRELDPRQAIEAAKECYRAMVLIAHAYQNKKWLAAASSGAVCSFIREYQISRSEGDFNRVEEMFLEIIKSCDEANLTEEATSNRINYAKLLMEAAHGDRFNHVDKAIALLRQVLDSISPETNPDRYSRVLYNLGAALLEQNEAPHMRNLYFNEAVDCFYKALEYRPADKDPAGRARILRALASVLPDWEGADSLPQAQYLADIASAEADALEAGHAIPESAAFTPVKRRQSALFWDYEDIPASRPDLLTAIYRHETRIKQIPKETFPYLYAEWLGGVARLLSRVAIEDNDRDLIEKASAAFLNAIEAIPEEIEPRLRLMLFRELGRLMHESGNWEGSLFANGKTVDIGLALADLAGTDVSRSRELESFTRAIHFAAFAAAQLNKYAEAVEFAEIGRARWLDEAIRLASIRMSLLPSEFKAAVDDTQGALLELERQEHELLGQGIGGAVRNLENYLGVPIGGFLKTRMTADPNGVEAKIRKDLSDVRQQIQKKHENLNDLLSSVADKGIIPARPAAAEVIAVAQQAGIAVVYLVSSVWGSTAIFVGNKNGIIQIPSLTREMIKNLLYGTNDYVRRASRSDSTLEPVLKAIQQVLEEHLIPPVRQWCVENNINSLAIIGLGDIGMLPLQVATAPAGLSILLLPSARALMLSQPKLQQTSSVKLLTVGGVMSNDLPPLNYSAIESRFFTMAFKKSGADVTDLSDSATQADVEAQIPQSTHIHFSCHGSFKSFSPLTSTIHLEGNNVIQVADLLRPALKLMGVELVILSACNSASTEFWKTPDETIGFPAAFLAAGVKTVVAAQWPVSDAATLLLMQQFCTELLENGMNAAKSLGNAQRWLQKATKADIESVLANLQDGLGQYELRSKRLLTELRNEIKSLGEQCPFSGRQIWAAFVCVGA